MINCGSSSISWAVRIRTYVRPSVPPSVGTYVHTYITHTHTYIYICIYIYVHICAHTLSPNPLLCHRPRRKRAWACYKPDALYTCTSHILFNSSQHIHTHTMPPRRHDCTLQTTIKTLAHSAVGLQFPSNAAPSNFQYHVEVCVRYLTLFVESGTTLLVIYWYSPCLQLSKPFGRLRMNSR